MNSRPQAVVVTYDISDSKRRRHVFDTCRGFGDHLQLSVFRMELSQMAIAQLVAALDAVIKHDEDQVLLITLGAASARTNKAFRSLGRAYVPPPRGAIIV